jgi:two-component system, NarL family, response regulator DesR
MYPDSVGSSVLVVDDDALFRDVISRLLLARGFEVAGHAADEAEAIEAVQQLHPDAVLLDVNLASSDGFALSAQLSGLDEDITVLLTSSDPDAATDELAQQCGATGFVPKTQLAGTNLRQYLCPR